MTTKELIQVELDTLSDEELDELYTLIKSFTQSKRHAQPQRLMAALRRIKIEAPPDFAANLDCYVNGEKRAEPDLHCYPLCRGSDQQPQPVGDTRVTFRVHASGLCLPREQGEPLPFSQCGPPS